MYQDVRKISLDIYHLKLMRSTRSAAQVCFRNRRS
jgi:hypothetical protein